MEEQDDALLVRATLAGDKEAFSALVRKYQDYAYGVAIGLLSDFDLAHDVTQDSFWCAYRDLKKLKDPSRFGGWLRGIVRHVAYRVLRELSRVRGLAEELKDSEGLVDQGPTPAASMEKAEEREIVRRALERLDEKNREAISLYYVDGLSYEDISVFLGVNEATVQGRLQRGRKKLRREIKMVERTFKEKRLPEDFSAEIARLLEVAASRGQEHAQAIKRLAAIGIPAVDPLAEALGDPRVPVRRAAAAALCKIGDVRALRPVLRVLCSPESWALNDVLKSGRILSIPGIKEELYKIVGDDKIERCGRCMAIEALSHLADDQETYDRIHNIFRDQQTDLKVRFDALNALCRIKKEAGSACIVEALTDPSFGYTKHWWAWWIAWRNGCLVPIDVCARGFRRDVVPKGRVFAGWLMLKHGLKGREVLQNIMRTGSRDERAAAALALAEKDNGEAFDVLMSELIGGYRHQKWVRFVSYTVMRCYGNRIVEWVSARKPDLAKCPAVALLLAKARIAAGQGTADDLLRYGSPSVRAAAVKTVAKQKGPLFMLELRQYLREGQPRKVAQEAFWQIYRLKDQAESTVQEMFLADHWTERKAAVCLLRRWGKLTPEQKAKAEGDSHIAVRHAAHWHIKRRRVTTP